MSRVDVVVIGAGVNGLVAATLLAKRGKSVVLVERRDVAGGLAAGEEFHPGYRTVGVLHDASAFRPGLVRELDLERHGLKREASAPDVFAPETDGPGLRIAHDPAAAHAEIAAHSPRDADRYAEYRAFLARLGPFARGVLEASPPDPERTSKLTLARTGWALRRLGRRDMMELLRIGPMRVADWLNEWFETELLACALAVPSLLHGFVGPWSPGTNALLLRHEFLVGHPIRGGPAALVRALEASARAAGVEIRLGAEVSGMLLEKGAAAGVTMAAGEELASSAVLATCDPKTALLGLVPPAQRSPRLTRHIEGYRCAGSTAKVNLALSQPFRLASRPNEPMPGVVRIGATFDDQERAFDPVKYGELPSAPILEIIVPSETDPACAPAGHAVLSILVHAVPSEPSGGWTDERRTELGNIVVRTLARYAPDLEASIVARDVATPADLARRYGVWGGHLMHGEHGLDQLLARPTPECAAGGTPWPGIRLGGSGSWPGGGVLGVPGALAAGSLVGSQSRA